MILLKNITFAIVFFGMVTITHAHDWMAPAKDAVVKNPLVKNEINIDSGKTVYNDFCLRCHGADARGLAPGETGLKKRPTNLQKTLKSHSDGDVFWKIQNGRGEMPSFKDDLEDGEIWQVILFLRSL